nr:hypothetical protein [Tanacetum cinerariifolium]
MARVSDVPSDDSEEELSWKSSDNEEVGSHEEGKESDDDSDDGSDNDSEKEEGSFDPIPRTPEDSEKESDDEEEQE